MEVRHVGVRLPGMGVFQPEVQPFRRFAESYIGKVGADRAAFVADAMAGQTAEAFGIGFSQSFRGFLALASRQSEAKQDQNGKTLEHLYSPKNMSRLNVQ